MAGLKNISYDDRDSSINYATFKWSLDGSWNASNVGRSGTLTSASDLTATLTFTFPEPANAFYYYGIPRCCGANYSICVDCYPDAPQFTTIDALNVTDDGHNPPDCIGFASDAMVPWVYDVTLSHDSLKTADSYVLWRSTKTPTMVSTTVWRTDLKGTTLDSTLPTLCDTTCASSSSTSCALNVHARWTSHPSDHSSPLNSFDAFNRLKHGVKTGVRGQFGIISLFVMPLPVIFSRGYQKGATACAAGSRCFATPFWCGVLTRESDELDRYVLTIYLLGLRHTVRGSFDSRRFSFRVAAMNSFKCALTADNFGLVVASGRGRLGISLVAMSSCRDYRSVGFADLSKACTLLPLISRM
ncbi:hypothetical protein BDZ89DRAFT_1145651 [Hymenopellis radicata]|nr:hypothetical protein BDZ89DRAFT_1145651 [Hymenopellis radicata]